MPQYDLPGSEPTPINRTQLCDPDYAMAAMLPIFAQAMGRFSGKMVNPGVWVALGMKRVFDYWCQNGNGCGDEMIDTAADVAYMVAAQVYPDPETLQVAFDSVVPYMLKQIGQCNGYRPGTTTGFSAQVVPTAP